MRATWEALRRSLRRSIGTLQAQQEFDEAKANREPLRRFDTPAALVSFLTTGKEDLDDKDLVLAALVRWVQAGGRTDLATALLWLGLWPGLDRLYWRLMPGFADEPETLVSEVGDRFTAAIHKADLEQIGRVAATLVRNVERDVREEQKRRWADAARREFLPFGPPHAGEDWQRSDPRPGAHGGRLRTRGVSRLGLPPRLDVDEDIRALRRALEALVGDDAALLLGAVLYGSQREVGEQAGLSHAAVRKRVQRAQARLRKMLSAEK